ncbi:MAG: PAS domain S-box protein [Deltaproteobacteria bacterium]|nr:PAS domain S-box protein [Deltaproteobacteria bacterium]
MKPVVKEGSLSLSTGGSIIRFGYGLELILGYCADELIGKDISCLFPPALAGQYRSLIDSARASHAISGSKIKILKKDGSLTDIYLSIYPLRSPSGEVYSFILTFSSEVNTEVPVILSDEFQRIFRFSNDAVTITDRDGNIIDVNKAYLDTYGYEREEVLGKNPRILQSQHSKKELYERMWRDILDPRKGFWRGEIINLTKDGVEVPMLLSINAIKDAQGEIKNFLCIAFNMSKQKELDRLRRLYIDHIIHDIRGPLTTIMANAELLFSKLAANIPEKERRKLEVIISSSRRIDSMAADILDYSRAQAGKVALKKSRVSMSKVLREAFLPFENSGKRLMLNGSPYHEGAIGDKEILADEDKLKRVIYNLLSNATKYAASEVKVETEFTDDWLKFTVSDDGKGISALEAERIFEAFYQTEEGIKTGGAGLGLSIVKTFVEAHHGKVWVEPGQKGATFRFLIPHK